MFGCATACVCVYKWVWVSVKVSCLDRCDVRRGGLKAQGCQEVWRSVQWWDTLAIANRDLTDSGGVGVK